MTGNVIPLHGDLPAGATAEGTGQWQAGQPDRVIYAHPRLLPDNPAVAVHAAAIQQRNGTITGERHILVAGADTGLTPGQARQLANLLVAAADELDSWGAP